MLIFQDPDRTREAIKRKLKSMKRRRAFDRRQKEQQQRELERFKAKRTSEAKPVLPDKLNGIPIWPYRRLRGGADRQDANVVSI